MKSPSDHASILWELNVDCPKKIKPIKLPNSKLEREITNPVIQNAQNKTAIQLLKDFTQRIRSKGTRAFKHISYKQQHNFYQKFLLNLDENDDAITAIKMYWSKFWRIQERIRYSTHSKEAYNTMRNILKYHTYAKRDGSIVNSFLLPNNQIVDDPNHISHIIIRTLRNIQDNPRMLSTTDTFLSQTYLTSPKMKDCFFWNQYLEGKQYPGIYSVMTS